MTVGASDLNDTAATADDSLAVFFSCGTSPDGFAEPEITGPGRHLVTTTPTGSTIPQGQVPPPPCPSSRQTRPLITHLPAAAWD